MIDVANVKAADQERLAEQAPLFADTTPAHE